MVLAHTLAKVFPYHYIISTNIYYKKTMMKGVHSRPLNVKDSKQNRARLV
uniref:Uncharacterized protein n=1 Tax=Arundo donax TaxID=35708 RepID=A0A0A9H927_ARUDO